MKKLNLFIVFAGCLFSTSGIMAQQDSSGIFKTSNDFQDRKLSYAINYKTETHQINDDMLFKDGEIKVTHAGQTYMLDKDSTYGYRSMKGEDFRFVSRNEYKIINPGERLMIYSYRHTLNANKGSIKYVVDYFFSANASASPQPLTKENLKAAYPTNHKFHDALDAEFKSDNNLASYDSFHKMTKLNHIILMNE